MSTSVIGNIFLKHHYTIDDSVTIESILLKYSDEVFSTRKGIHWEVSKDNYIFYIDIVVTASRLYLEIEEDELLDLNLMPEDVPSTIIVSSNNCSSTKVENLKFVTLLFLHIKMQVNGISSTVKYCD
jgi:hypothetical protein